MPFDATSLEGGDAGLGAGQQAHRPQAVRLLLAPASLPPAPSTAFSFQPSVSPETYRQRRADAAALWQTIPKLLFDMRNWECGSTACALGWLAALQHDGWRFSLSSVDEQRRARKPIGPDGLHGIGAAAMYFGISINESTACFAGDWHCARTHRRWFISRVTPRDVARTLLKLPLNQVTCVLNQSFSRHLNLDARCQLGAAAASGSHDTPGPAPAAAPERCC